MNNYVNKVIYGTSTLIDLTDDTITPETLQSGITAHNASGASIIGTAINVQDVLACMGLIYYNNGIYVNPDQGV